MMTSADVDDPWPRAAFFPEEPGGSADEATARDLSEQWRQRSCLDEERFALRLASEGFDLTSFGRILAAREALRGEGARQGAAPPAWQAILAEVFARWDELSAAPRVAVDGAPFTAALHPFLAHALAAVERDRPTIPGISLDGGDLRAALHRELARRLDVVCARVLVLELHVARLEGRLGGDDPTARFASFLALFGRREAWAALLDEYQVMARALAVALGSFTAAASELLVRLAGDAVELRAAGLLDPRPLSLSDARGGMSDLHRRGRSVWILHFTAADGARSRLVYKPRSLAAEACFERLLAWIDARADEGSLRVAGAPFPRHRALGMLSREAHGWVEHVAPAPCASTEEAARFFQRQGGVLALLYLLRGVDLHADNLIAVGEHPVLIDLEALFHRDDLPETDDGAAARAMRRLHASVVRVGFLPNRVFGEDGRPGANISALGDGEAECAPFLRPVWERVGTDEMELVVRERALVASANLPRLGGVVVPVTAHEEDLVAGFEAVYRLLASRREELCAPGGPIEAFARVELRHVIRATHTYGQILEDMTHPDHQRDAADVEALLDVLWLIDRAKEKIPRVIPAERDDLRDGDVPIFLTRPGSRDLWDSRGRRVPGYFVGDAITEVKAHAAAFSEEDLRLQRWLVRASVATLRPMHAPARAPSSLRDAGPLLDLAGLRADLLGEAERIGDRLLASAIEGARDVTWLGLGLGARDQWALAPVGLDLYTGTAGIGVFLATLAGLTDGARFAAMARRVAEALVAAAEARAADRPVRLGGFVGEGSELYAVAVLSRALGDPSLLARAAARLDRFARAPVEPAIGDVIGGEAGTLLALLAAHEAGAPGALAAAEARGEALCARAEAGFASLWPEGEPPLLGFSHGAAGIACALLALHRALGPAARSAARILGLAGRALDFERARFDAAQGNWPRLDGASPHGGDMIAWCHGAPGVALGRTLALSALDDGEARREITVAVGTTLARGLGRGRTLCHGDLGNLVVVRRAADALDRDDWKAATAHHAARLLAEIRRGPSAGTAPEEVSPGLLCGLAGIGHGLLYLAAPDAVPLVLGLQTVS